MCLAVPGKIISIEGDDAFTRCGQVQFADVIREANLAFVPEAVVGDYVLIHAGIAISVLHEDAVASTFHILEGLQ